MSEKKRTASQPGQEQFKFNCSPMCDCFVVFNVIVIYCTLHPYKDNKIVQEGWLPSCNHKRMNRNCCSMHGSAHNVNMSPKGYMTRNANENN